MKAPEIMEGEGGRTDFIAEASSDPIVVLVLFFRSVLWRRWGSY